MRFLRFIPFALLVMAVIACSSGGTMPPLGGALAPTALRGDFLNAIATSTEIDLLISLRGRRQDEIERLIRQQNTPGDAHYMHYLTPAQYGRSFGASERDYAAAVRSLRSHGFVVDGQYANRIDIAAHAPARIVESYFGTPIDVRVERGRIFYSNRYAPRFPAGLQIAYVAGLDDYVQLRPNDGHIPAPGAALNPSAGWNPQAMQSVYDLTPVYTKYTGAGLTVIDATVGTVRQSDFAAFTSKYGLKATLAQIALKGAPIDDQGESTLDVEWMAGIAPRVHVLLVSAKNSYASSFVAMHAQIVNQLAVHHIVSTSWGGCERGYYYYGPIAQEERLFEQADVEGQHWLAAAGDWGSDDCELKTNGVQAVDYPGSSTHVVSVGGTSVVPASIDRGVYTGWGGETVWNSACGAGGGGNSIFFPRPYYQNGLSGAFMREVPDVVLMGDGCDLGGYIIYFKGQWQKNWYGTSFAAPEWAAFLTLIESRYGRSNPIPDPHYRLYALFASSGRRLFHNIVRGCNTYMDVPGYCAHPGYSPAGGLGSFDGAALLAAY
jgi:subtilase family serine protease